MKKVITEMSQSKKSTQLMLIKVIAFFGLIFVLIILKLISQDNYSEQCSVALDLNYLYHSSDFTITVKMCRDLMTATPHCFSVVEFHRLKSLKILSYYSDTELFIAHVLLVARKLPIFIQF